MKKDTLSPEQSIKYIEDILKQAKDKYTENGGSYIYFGFLVALASFAQFYMIQIGEAKISYYPYFIIPIGWLAIYIFMFYRKSKRIKQKSTPIEKIVWVIWTTIGINIMILSFLMGYKFLELLIPVNLILVSFGTVFSGFIIKDKVLIYSGLITNIIAFGCVFLDFEYHSLIQGVAMVLCFIIPGFILLSGYKKQIND